MKRMKSNITMLLLCTSLLLGLAGCGSERQPVVIPDGTYVYYLSEEENSLYPVEYTLENEDTEAAIEELFYKLETVPEQDEYRSPIPETITITGYDIHEDTLTVDFSEAYGEMEKTHEVLTRAAIVRTVLQAEGIKKVTFTVDGEPAVDAMGNKIGNMTSETFVENAKQINAYQNVAIDLYFADETGTMLNKESRSIYYSSSKPLEWAIVERLIAGPKSEGNRAAIAPSTQILSVTNSDEICYVNLSRSFISDAISVDEKLPIYSIVNSICYNCKYIKKVQFSIEGDSDVIFGTDMSLKKTYRPDESLMWDPDSTISAE